MRYGWSGKADKLDVDLLCWARLNAWHAAAPNMPPRQGGGKRADHLSDTHCVLKRHAIQAADGLE